MAKLITFVTTLVSMLILMTAVELIAPDNSMKKYLRFILGLILISVMLTPIISILTNGEEELIVNLKKYVNNYEAVYDKDTIEKGNEKSEALFKENLNNNCNKILKDEFVEDEFESDVTCNVDLKDMTYDIEKIKVGVSTGGVNIIKKIKINIKEETSEAIAKNQGVENEEEIKKYLGKVLKVPEEKIEVYKLER